MQNKRTILTSELLARCGVVLGMLVSGTSVYAAAWIGGTGSWNDGGNWSGGTGPGGVPAAGEGVFISQANAVVNVDSAGNLGGSMRQGEIADTTTINIDYAGAGTALTLSSGTWDVGHRNGSTAIVHHNNGAVSGVSINVGGHQTATGTYNMNGGSLTASGNLTVGTLNASHVGVGTFTMNEGAVSVNQHVTIGSSAGGAGSSGTMTLSGGSFSTMLGGNWTTTIGGNGTLNVEGSSVTISHANQFSVASGGTMRYALDAGGASVFNINNNVFLDGILQLDMLDKLSTPGDILLLDKESGGAISGSFGQVVTPFGTFSGNEGSEITMGSGSARYYYELSYAGGNGNDLVLQLNDFGFIPEPGTTTLFLLGGLMLAWRRSRK